LLCWQLSDIVAGRKGIMSETCQLFLRFLCERSPSISNMAAIAPVEAPWLAGHRAVPVALGSRARPWDIGSESALDPGICWQAIYSRDPRFDGRFFMGATTTGIYCRNICPVPFARPRNVVLFACAAAAESAGFRPCKRCQAQAAPGTPAWLGTSAVVNHAFRLIVEGALNDGGVEELAERMGIGPRHLRRLFMKHLGASPLKIATTRRIHLARNLIDESALPMTQIAFCSGFKSIREFNHAVRLSTGQSPSELRRAAASPSSTARPSGLELRLPYRRPFDWGSLIAFLKQRAIPGVELVTENFYQRTIEVAGMQGFLTVKPDSTGPRLVANLEIKGSKGLEHTVERIRRIFDLGADPIQIASHLSRDPKLRQLLKLRPGLRVPGVWDGFETAVLAVIGQKLTAPGSKRSVTHLVQMFGTPIETPIRGLKYLFPRPEILAHADLSKAGISKVHCGILRNLARATMHRHLTFSTLRTLEETVSQVGAACGIDESTANYIAMRAFGEPDAFPSKEQMLRRRITGLKPIVSPAEAIDLADQWRPWRAYAAMHFAQ
jgi:AraC family transcriptional regulator of adaptative response / DNA-3-methyladenine glycosylase II